MSIVAFDTATPATAVAVLTPEGGVVGERHDPAPGERPGHAAQLLPLLERTLAAAGAGWRDVERIGVGVGPGGFTGLRIGIATARALAQARGLPLVGVSSLRALAAGAAQDSPLVLAVIDARRGEAYVAGWHHGEEALPAAARSPAELASAAGQAGRETEQTPLAVGDGAVRFRSELEAAGAMVPPDGSPLHRIDAAHTCRLAARMPAPAAGTVLPDYLRVPDAELRRPPPRP
ncbi:MAG: tRNA threonylcarbamoyladenosine biosynthesis protein TsaB [Solirubrobacteraceae bacterium]|nr:tRNA threonylcarbamoyladenosine biosynthesis protein TsaB [Solirubrobacteraceae bacterium]